MISETHNVDCMEFMEGLPDGFFDLVIADPPYGIGEDGSKSASRAVKSEKWRGAKAKYVGRGWDSKKPTQKLLNEIKRVSKNQIVWGANHFISSIPIDSSAWVVWYKKRFDEINDFSDCELAYSSFKSGARLFHFPWIGFGAVNAKETRQHPTQKPVALYKWLLTNYAKPGHKIFDPMMGSQSSRIAAHDMGFDYWGCELDADYFRDGEARYKAHIAKPVLFPPEQMYFPEQVKLF